MSYYPPDAIKKYNNLCSQLKILNEKTNKLIANNANNIGPIEGPVGPVGPPGISGETQTLEEVSDVMLNNPEINEYLLFDGNNWINSAVIAPMPVEQANVVRYNSGGTINFPTDINLSFVTFDNIVFLTFQRIVFDLGGIGAIPTVAESTFDFDVVIPPQFIPVIDRTAVILATDLDSPGVIKSGQVAISSGGVLQMQGANDPFLYDTPAGQSSVIFSQTISYRL